MNLKVAVFAVLIGLGSSATISTQAIAQPGWYGPYADVPPSQVMRIVRGNGFNPISRPVMVGPNYVVQAVDRYGDLKRVVVDAEFGDVVRVVSVNRPPPPSAPPPWARNRGAYDERMAALPPRGIPQQPPLAGQPQSRPRTAALPQTTPLPRPRPAESPAVPKPEATEQVTPPAPEVKPEPPTASVPAPSKPADAPAAETPRAAQPETNAAPRVILPGGPPVKGEESVTPPASESQGIPPAQSLE